MPRKLTEERSGRRRLASPAASLLGWAKAETFSKRRDMSAAMTAPPTLQGPQLPYCGKPYLHTSSPMGCAERPRLMMITGALFHDSPQISVHKSQVPPAGWARALPFPQVESKTCANTCWNPENTLPLQDGSVEVWPRREKTPAAGTYVPGWRAYYRAVSYNILGETGSIARGLQRRFGVPLFGWVRTRLRPAPR